MYIRIINIHIASILRFNRLYILLRILQTMLINIINIFSYNDFIIVNNNNNKIHKLYINKIYLYCICIIYVRKGK